MKYTEDHMNEKPLFVIEEKPDVIEGQTEGETPVITIEEAPSDSPRGELINVERERVNNPRRWLWFVGGLLLSALLCVAAVLGWRYYRSSPQYDLYSCRLYFKNFTFVIGKPRLS